MNARQNSIFPSVPGDKQIADNEGELTTDWSIWFENITRGGQTNFKSQGFVIPTIDATTFATLTGPASHNNIVYNSTTSELKFNVDGVWKTIQLV